jgi:hypothetical protein
VWWAGGVGWNCDSGVQFTLCRPRNSTVPHEAVSLNNMAKTKTVFPIPGFLMIQTLKYTLDTTTIHFAGLELSCTSTRGCQDPQVIQFNYAPPSSLPTIHPYPPPPPPPPSIPSLLPHPPTHPSPPSHYSIPRH